MTTYIFIISLVLSFGMIFHKMIEIRIGRELLFTKFVKRGDKLVISGRDLIQKNFSICYQESEKLFKVYIPELTLRVGESILFSMEEFGSRMSLKIRGAKRITRDEKVPFVCETYAFFLPGSFRWSDNIPIL